RDVRVVYGNQSQGVRVSGVFWHGGAQVRGDTPYARCPAGREPAPAGQPPAQPHGTDAELDGGAEGVCHIVAPAQAAGDPRAYASPRTMPMPSPGARPGTNPNATWTSRGLSR